MPVVPRTLIWADNIPPKVFRLLTEHEIEYIEETTQRQFVMLAASDGFNLGLILDTGFDMVLDPDFELRDSEYFVEPSEARSLAHKLFLKAIELASDRFPIFVFSNNDIPNVQRYIDEKELRVEIVTDWTDKATWLKIKERANAPKQYLGLADTPFPRQNIPQIIYSQTSRFTDSNSLTVEFEFPSQVAVHCRQYLEYFTKFLEELGIGATSDTVTKASTVLFSVTPSDPEEALSMIQQALAVYLQLPTSNFDVADSNPLTAIANNQLAATVEHLRGQLAIENAKGQMKDALLLTQSEVIGAQRTALQQFQVSANVMMESVKAVSNPTKEPDSEPLLGEHVKLTSFKWWGIEVNPAHGLRQIKGWLNRDQLPPP